LSTSIAHYLINSNVNLGTRPNGLEHCLGVLKVAGLHPSSGSESGLLLTEFCPLSYKGLKPKCLLRHVGYDEIMNTCMSFFFSFAGSLALVLMDTVFMQ
jgi:hypothetical protein